MTRLSICIATFRRGDYIGATLATIAPQLTDGVELIVLDGASPDDTQAVVREFAKRYPNIRYVREQTNSGIDADYDKSVHLAKGDHCWLFTDDDFLFPGAIDAVLAELAQSDPDLMVIDAEVRDRHMVTRFEPRRLPFQGRREYGAADADAMMADLGNGLSFIGSAIIRRSLWMERERLPYYGTLFIHAGVIFQRPLAKVVALGTSLIQIRVGNAMWSARAFEIWMLLWPRLIWSFSGFGDAAKLAVTPQSPWRHPRKLLIARAQGGFGPIESRRLRSEGLTGARAIAADVIARMPGRLAHLLAVTLLTVIGQGRASSVYQLLVTSRFSNRASWSIARLAGMHGR